MKNPTTVLTLTAVAATTLALGGLGTIARANSILEEEPSILVHFEDLDTNTGRGAALLYRRIELAAETVCGDLAPRNRLSLSARYAACVRTAVADAIGKVNRPLLTQYAITHGVPAASPIKVKVARTQPAQ
jgi:UrcA family protein